MLVWLGRGSWAAGRRMLLAGTGVGAGIAWRLKRGGALRRRELREQETQCVAGA